MGGDDIRWYQIALAFLVLAWAAEAYVAYLRISEYGAFAAVVTGLAVLAYAPSAARRSEEAWLYGWKGQTMQPFYFNGPLLGVVFFAPAIRRGLLRWFPDLVEGRNVTVVAAAVAAILGMLAGFWIITQRIERVDVAG